MRYFEWYRKNINEEVVPLISQDGDWEHEMLRIAGIDLNSAKRWQRELTNVETLVLPQHRQPVSGYHPSRADYEWLRDRFQQNVSENREHPPRIYISREDAEERRIRNEQSLMERLDELDFSRFELSSLTIAEQVNLFEKADIIVAPHGAGLSNIVFSENVSIVEIQLQTDIQPHYYVLAKTLEHDYSYILGERVDDDILVKTDAVIEAVRQII